MQHVVQARVAVTLAASLDRARRQLSWELSVSTSIGPQSLPSKSLYSHQPSCSSTLYRPDSSPEGVIDKPTEICTTCFSIHGPHDLFVYFVRYMQ
jgi:hypothetical protein